MWSFASSEKDFKKWLAQTNCLNKHVKEGSHVHLWKRKKKHMHTDFKRLHISPQLSVNPLSCCISRLPCETCIKANRHRQIQASHSHTHWGAHAFNSLEAEWRSSWCVHSLSVHDRSVCLKGKCKVTANILLSCGLVIYMTSLCDVQSEQRQKRQKQRSEKLMLD